MGLFSSLSGAKSVKKGAKKAIAALEDSGNVTATGGGGSTRIEDGNITTQGIGDAAAQQFLEQAQRMGQSVDQPGFDAVSPEQAYAQASQGAQAATDAGTGFLGGARNFLDQLKDFDLTTYGAEQLSKLDELARPGEERAASSLANRLFSQGRMGGDDTKSGVAFGELAQAQDRAATQRSLDAMGLSYQHMQNMLGGATGLGQFGLQGLQAGSGLFGNALQQGTGLAGFNQQFQGQNIQNVGAMLANMNAALNPGYQQTQFGLQGAGLNLERAQAMANVHTGAGQAAGNAKGSLMGSLIGGFF